ncbi:MAG TPA: hypothetical protein VGK73_25265 [Polyangiaceae bacterium]
MAKNNFTRGAHGRFTGSTGGAGTFALTGGSRAGGIAGIKARAKLRVAQRKLADAADTERVLRATHGAHVPKIERQRLASAGLPSLGTASRERLANAIKRRRAEVARIESGAPVVRKSTADKLQSAQSRLAKLTSAAARLRNKVNADLMAGRASTAFQPMRLAERRSGRAQRLVERLRARAARQG